MRGSESSCVRGCCHSDSVPLAIPKSDIQIITEIARGSTTFLFTVTPHKIGYFLSLVMCFVPGAESVVYEARFGGKSVAAKKPRLSTANDIDRFHTELQLLRYENTPKAFHLCLSLNSILQNSFCCRFQLHLNPFNPLIQNCLYYQKLLSSSSA